MIFLLATVAGCIAAKSTVTIGLENRSEIVGTWKGRFEPNAYPRVGSTIFLKFKPDGNYEYFIYANTYKGTYRIENGKVVLKPGASERDIVITYYDSESPGGDKELRWTSQRGEYSLTREK